MSADKANKPRKTWDATFWDLDRDSTWLRSIAPVVSAIKASYEVCPETGKDHIQARMTFRRAYRLSGLKKLHPTAHWGETLCPQDMLYPDKVDSKVFLHIQGGRGKRTDLLDLRQAIDNGATRRTLLKEHFPALCSAHKVAGEAILYRDMEAPNRLKEVRWYWGVSGAGKTHAAMSEPDAWKSNTPQGGVLKWWDTYDGHQTIVIDELREGHLAYSELLRILDGKARVEIKGGHVVLNPELIIITSDKPPELLYPEYDRQLERRIHEVRAFKTPFGETPTEEWIPSTFELVADSIDIEMH